MKNFIFEDLAKKYTLGQQVKIEDDIRKLESHLHMRKEILKIAKTRDASIAYWNDAKPETRKNFGKSQDEIENGDNAKFHSVVSFENVSDKSFEELTEFWQAVWLSGTVDFFSGSTKKTLDFEREAEN